MAEEEVSYGYVILLNLSGVGLRRQLAQTICVMMSVAFLADDFVFPRYHPRVRLTCWCIIITNACLLFLWLSIINPTLPLQLSLAAVIFCIDYALSGLLDWLLLLF